jgi:hypothetical protein
MRKAPMLAALVIGALTVLSGCGQQHPPSSPAGTHATAQGNASARSGPRPAAACRGTSVAPSIVFIGNSDNRRSLCVRRSTALVVYLRGSASSPWAAIHASSAVLKPIVNAFRASNRGVTGAAYVAVRSGTASIISMRHRCGQSVAPGKRASKPATPPCGAPVVFHVTVIVK